jgi:hypothetical protein
MGQISSTTYDSSVRTLATTDADGQITLYVYGDRSLTPTAFASLPGSADQLYGRYYFATTADYQAYIADPTGSKQPNETIVYSYYTAADVTGGGGRLARIGRPGQSHHRYAHHTAQWRPQKPVHQYHNVPI